MDNQLLLDNQALLDNIVERILAVQPQARIVLFGSRAQGRFRSDSDVDLVIVVPRVEPGEPRSARIRRSLRGMGVGFDLIVLTEAEWSAMRYLRNTVVYEAAQTGRVLHGAA